MPDEQLDVYELRQLGRPGAIVAHLYPAEPPAPVLPATQERLF